MYLLFTDTHLDDNPDNEYRWQIFDLVRAARTRYSISHIFCLGDLVDRKDRFAGSFINRLLSELKDLSITILRGNHDTPLHPPSYFSFMTEEFLRHNIHYINEPTIFGHGGLMLLPFTARPKTDWAGINFRDFKCVFMHATVDGAMAENGTELRNPNFPMLPGSVKFYSGDVHNQQTIHNVTYVGCPYPIHFGDRYPCRMLLIDEHTFEIVKEIKLSPQQKLMVDISSVEDLRRISVRGGDQVKIRFTCEPSEIESFGRYEVEIAAWAAQRGVTIAGTEVIVPTLWGNGSVEVDQNPEFILKQFAQNEGLTDGLLDVGLDLLREVT